MTYFASLWRPRSRFDRRRAPLGGVDDAALQRRIHLGTGEDHGGGAEATGDLGPRAGGAHLQPLEILQRLDLPVGVEEQLGREDAARNRGDAELLLAIVEPHLGTARLVQVHHQLFGLKAAGHPREDDRRLVHAPVVAHPVVADLGHPGLHDVRDLEILAEHPRREDVDLDVAVGHGLDQSGIGIRVLEEDAGQGGRHGPLLGGHAGERRGRGARRRGRRRRPTSSRVSSCRNSLEDSVRVYSHAASRRDTGELSRRASADSGSAATVGTMRACMRPSLPRIIGSPRAIMQNSRGIVNISPRSQRFRAHCIGPRAA